MTARGIGQAVLPADLRGVHVHFVGVKGTGMAALAEIFCGRGAVITGSDVPERFYTDEILERLGIRAAPFGAENITKDVALVVYSSAYDPARNPDLAEAGRRGVPRMLYTEALGGYSARAYSCGICGVHGKTSTTGLAGTILRETGLPAQALAGSVIRSFGDSCTYTAPGFSAAPVRYFVAETCEYRRHFLSFCPKKIVLTSVESDHQDCFPTYADIRDAFVEYACRLPERGQLIYCADDPGAAETASLASARRPDIRLVPYGENAEGDYHLEFGRAGEGRLRFSLGLLGELCLTVPGRHEIRDAAAAAALVCELLRREGKNPLDYAESVRRGLESFSGGRRRSEVIGRAVTPSGNSVIFIDDYGHHPTAIRTTLAGYREFYGGRRIIVDFMSHTYTRTAALLEEFASCFGDADEVILHKIYASAREDASAAAVDGRTLYERAKKHHGNVRYFEEVSDARDFVLSELDAPAGGNCPEGVLFVTMGAGDNWKLGADVCAALGGKKE